MNSSQAGQRRAAASTSSPTRTALLEASRACVREHGIANTTSRSIAAAAGANLGAITYYFGSKDELLAEALYGELEARLAPVLARLEADDEPASTRLIGAVQMLVAEFERSTPDVPVYLDAVMLSTRPGPLADRARTMLTELKAKLARVIAALRDDGLIATWVEPEAMASVLIAAGNGIAMQTRLDDGHGVSDLAGQLAGLLLAASQDGPRHRPARRSRS